MEKESLVVFLGIKRWDFDSWADVSWERMLETLKFSPLYETGDAKFWLKDSN